VIVVDSSVWISHFSNVLHPEVELLRQYEEVETILVGDVVLVEVLKGAHSEGAARFVESKLASFDQVSMLDADIARRAAANYRRLWAIGITIRSSIDVIIGTYCLTHDYALLHRDRDFDHFEQHLGLRVVR